MHHFLLVTFVLLLGCAFHAIPVVAQDPALRQQATRGLHRALLEAVRAQDDAGIARLRQQWISELGGQAGVPDGQPRKPSPVDTRQSTRVGVRGFDQERDLFHLGLDVRQ
jgi:hypothetical protein